MNYKMTVRITDPKTKAGMMSELLFKLDCYFHYDEEQYGNGHYVTIDAENFNTQYIDLRYDRTFRRNEKEKWLEQWARNYWTGKNSAWAIKSLEIAKV